MRRANGIPSNDARHDGGHRREHDPFQPGMRLEELGQTLASAYDHLLTEGVPDHLCELMQGVKAAGTRERRRPARLALVVEDDSDVRALAETVIDETLLEVIGCESAEGALDVLRDREGQFALVFVDIRLAGDMDGVQLAQTVASRWPETRLVLTSGTAPDQPDAIPEQAVFMAKPWRPIDVLVEAERAIADTRPML